MPCLALEFSNESELLRFLLLLLPDTDLEMLKLGFLVGLVIVSRHRIAQVRIHVGIPRQYSHQREILIASRAKRAESFHVGNSHITLRLPRMAVPSHPAKFRS